MHSINVNEAKERFYELICLVTRENEVITIMGDKGKNAVLLSKSKWKSIQDTLYLSSIPGFVDNINETMKNEDWDNASEYDSNEEW